MYEVSEEAATSQSQGGRWRHHVSTSALIYPAI